MLVTAAAAGFYEAAAQVLPIFLLVMLVGDARLGSGDSRDAPLWFRLLAYMLNAAIILTGLVAALIATGSGGTLILQALVSAAIASGCAYLVMRFVVTVLRESSDDLSAAARRRQLRLVAFLSLTTFAVVDLTLAFAAK